MAYVARVRLMAAYVSPVRPPSALSEASSVSGVWSSVWRAWLSARRGGGGGAPRGLIARAADVDGAVALCGGVGGVGWMGGGVEVWVAAAAGAGLVVGGVGIGEGVVCEGVGGGQKDGWGGGDGGQG